MFLVAAGERGPQARVKYVHWINETVMHSGIETMLRYLLKKMYNMDGRSLVKMIETSCQRCRYLNKKASAILMEPISKHVLNIAPSYYVSHTDLAGPFLTYSSHQAFTRFSCEVGYTKRILADGESQLVKGCDTVEFSFPSIQQTLFQNIKVEPEVRPLGGHNMHGRGERRIQEVTKSLDTKMSNERLDLLQWETVSYSIANSINILPLALGNAKGVDRNFTVGKLDP